MNFRVPIIWLTTDGRKPIDRSEIAHPFIEVEVAQDIGGNEVNWVRTFALVDTGSTFGQLEKEILLQLNVNSIGTREISGNSGVTTIGTYQICWRFACNPNCIISEKSGLLEHPLTTPQAKAAIGMSILQYGILSLNGLYSDSFFEFHASYTGTPVK